MPLLRLPFEKEKRIIHGSRSKESHIMRTPKGRKYISSAAEADKFKSQLKQIPCPCCGRLGYLIGHGYLRGYGESNDRQTIRGRRFFCSNRDRRRGCGRTFSLLFAHLLRNFSVSATTLWNFLKQVGAGRSRKAAWEGLRGGFSLETAYRLWRKIRHRQMPIRARLSREGPPPDTDSAEPLLEMVAHLQTVFSKAACPITAFQEEFQQGFPG